MPADRHSEVEHLARFTEAAPWLIPSEYRRFDYLAMADELRGGLPAMREIIVINSGARASMTRLKDLVTGLALMTDAAEERIGASSLARLAPTPRMPAVLQLSGGSTRLPKG